MKLKLLGRESVSDHSMKSVAVATMQAKHIYRFVRYSLVF